MSYRRSAACLIAGCSVLLMQVGTNEVLTILAREVNTFSDSLLSDFLCYFEGAQVPETK